MEGIGLTHGSLFSGMGGFDLAAQWAGWENVFHCEWKEFNQKILKYYWPEATTYNDITKSDFTIHRGIIDVLTGGFPCQPYSVAGKRKGKEDDRHLWPEMLRAIREIQPSWVVGENVGGLVNWNGGLVFDEVQADLENEGYEVLPFILPACAKNAPHRRDRVWFIAYSHSSADMRRSRKNESESSKERLPERNSIREPAFSDGLREFPITNTDSGTKRPSREDREVKSDGSENNDEQSSRGIEGQQHTGCGELLRNVANTQRLGQPRQGWPKRQVRSESFGEGKASWSDDDGGWPTQSPLCNGNDGFSKSLDGITFPKWRNESIMSGGNAIVPQIALEIFKVINQMELAR